MSAADVMETLDDAVALTGVDSVQVRHRPRFLSDNGPAYVSKELREYLDGRGMTHTRGRPYHPKTQGKIERYHRSMKNVVKLERYHSRGSSKRPCAPLSRTTATSDTHESLDNVTPSDVYYGRHQEVLSERTKIKRLTMQKRKKEYLATKAAYMEQNRLLASESESLRYPDDLQERFWTARAGKSLPSSISLSTLRAHFFASVFFAKVLVSVGCRGRLTWTS